MLVQAQMEALEKSDVNVHLDCTVEAVDGVVGSYDVHLSSGEELNVGAIIAATGALPYTPTEFDYGTEPSVVTNLELDELIAAGDVAALPDGRLLCTTDERRGYHKIQVLDLDVRPPALVTLYVYSKNTSRFSNRSIGKRRPS